MLKPGVLNLRDDPDSLPFIYRCGLCVERTSVTHRTDRSGDFPPEQLELPNLLSFVDRTLFVSTTQLVRTPM